MTKFYGSIEGAVGSRPQILNDADEEFASRESSIPRGQGIIKKEKNGMRWTIGLALFIVMTVAIAKTKAITMKSPAEQPLLEKAYHAINKPMTTLARPEEVAVIQNHYLPPLPFSTLDPVANLNLFDYDHRPESSSPGKVFDELHKGQKYTGLPLPTNKWYQNMLLISDGNEPTEQQRAYTVPYVINAIGPVPGIKLHSTRILGMARIVQVTFIDDHGVTLGAAKCLNQKSLSKQGKDFGVQRTYAVDYVKGEHVEGNEGVHGPLTPLGLTLKWNAEGQDHDVSSFTKMTSSIVRGMPYGTMHYHYINGDFGNTKPTIVSQIGMGRKPIADSKFEFSCSTESSEGKETLVNKSVEIFFFQSDQSWLVFFSEPAYVRCYEIPGEAPFVLQVTRLADAHAEERADVVFTSRLALMNNCTTGRNPLHCEGGQPNDMAKFCKLLKDGADVYPGKYTKIDYTFFSDSKEDGGEYSYLQFDWDARRVSDMAPTDGGGLLMYALVRGSNIFDISFCYLYMLIPNHVECASSPQPHHREVMHPQASSKNRFIFGDDMHCTPTLNGDGCIVDGKGWILREDLGGNPSFWAPRPPMPSALPRLAKALAKDIKFRVPEYFARGVGDTYFSGKMLAKLARILLIHKEMKDICANPSKHGSDYTIQCTSIALPSNDEFSEALDHLRSATEIWINGTAETPFVFDSKWAGIVSCGCLFNGETQRCNNVFPDCPSFHDPGLDFGHGFYNDHHFHQGYHIYAAATIAYFDPKWGKEMFENVLLLIRDFANPSPDDKFFPMYRMKDWYLGNSWAGGIAMAYPNGRNQESSSESIAAYEAVSLFGAVMAKNWARDDDPAGRAHATNARHIRDVGRLLTATEVRSADRYWHVRQEGPKKGIYPSSYQEYAVGIMWNVRSQGAKLYNAFFYICILLILFFDFVSNQMMAEFQTWFGAAPYLAIGIQLLPLTPVAEIRDDVDWAKQLYSSFAESCRTASNCDSDGWSVLQMAILATVGHPEKAIEYAESLPEQVFTTAGANGHSLSNTIWFYSTRPKTEPLELPTPAPTRSPSASGAIATVPVDSSHCPPCSSKVCRSNLNKCPISEAPFICIQGPARGGCSAAPWEHNPRICDSCCILPIECQSS